MSISYFFKQSNTEMKRATETALKIYITEAANLDAPIADIIATVRTLCSMLDEFDKRIADEEEYQRLLAEEKAKAENPTADDEYDF